MMFQWKPDMISFMTDASEHSDYHAQLAKIIAALAGSGGHICDAGCGLGYLSLALSPYFDRVTAIDRSPKAISVLQGKLPKDTNVFPVCADLQTAAPETPYDKMVFCLFGKIPEILALAKKQCRGKLIIIRKNWPRHSFSITPQESGCQSFQEICSLLSRCGIPYLAQCRTLELGQPLRSLEDTVRFFRLYSHDPEPERITSVQVLPRLILRDDPVFPYYLPAKKELGILALDVVNIPPDVPDLEKLL